MAEEPLFPLEPPTNQADPESVSSPASAPSFDFTAGIGDAEAASGVEWKERSPRGRKPPVMPGAKAELEDLFTPEGAGQIVAKGLDAFYRSCGAEPLEQSEKNAVAKISAHYMQTRLPKEASAYQPEILLFFTLGSTLLPRIKPVAETTAPFWGRVWDGMSNLAGRFVGLFSKKKATAPSE